MDFLIKLNHFMQSATPYILSIYALLIVPIAALIIKDSRKRKLAESKFKDAIQKILDSETESIAYKTALRIGKGVSLKDFQVHIAMSEIYSDLAGSEKSKKIETMLDDIERIDPYKSLPEDLKPALLHVEKKLDEANKDSSPLLIQPIKSHLVKYSELIDERDSLKKKSRRNTQITVVSAIVGLFGLLGTITSPSVSDIEALLEKNLEKKMVSHEAESNKSSNSDGDLAPIKRTQKFNR